MPAGAIRTGTWPRNIMSAISAVESSENASRSSWLFICRSLVRSTRTILVHVRHERLLLGLSMNCPPVAIHT